VTKLEDMSEPERQSWSTVLVDGGVFLYFWTKMTSGFSPRPIYTNMSEFGPIIIRLIVLTIVLHIVISIIFDMRKRKAAYQKDERDVAVERLGAHWGYRILTFGVGWVIICLLINNSLGEMEGYRGLGLGGSPIEGFIRSITAIKSPVEIIFALIVITYIADLIKHGIMLKAYRS